MHVVDGFLEKTGTILIIIHANQKVYLIFLILTRSRLTLIDDSRIIPEQHSSETSEKPSILGRSAVKAL
ncbi:hypothetical protein BFW01_g8167 [Lasiodiplodia theobromae]|nr:hypothetical protein BFW01_g8167 [Lasiodiplodia theobromae]